MNEPSLSRPATQSVLAQPVPVSALLALWVNAWCAGDVSGDSVVDALSSAGVNRVAGVDSDQTDTPATAGLITGLAALGISPKSAQRPLIRVALPRPGDARGLPGPPKLNVHAVTAGQLAIVDSLHLALLPANSGDPSLIIWQPLQTARDLPSVHAVRPEGAPSSIRAALNDAMTALTALDVVTSGTEVTDQMKSLSRALSRTPLPPTLSGQDRHTIHTAATIVGICELALGDVPAQSTATSERERHRVLTELSTVARQSLAATCSAR